MNKLIGLVGVLLVVIMLFLYMNAHKTQNLFQFVPTPTPTTSPTTEANHIVTLTIKNNKIAAGPTSLRIPAGEMIIFKISTDTSGIFHFNGYNKDVYLQKGKTVILSFLTTITGHFTYELADTKALLGSMDVFPQ